MKLRLSYKARVLILAYAIGILLGVLGSGHLLDWW